MCDLNALQINIDKVGTERRHVTELALLVSPVKRTLVLPRCDFELLGGIGSLSVWH